MRPDFVRARAFVAIGALAATLAGCSLGDSSLPPYTDPATQTYATALNVDISTMTRVNSQVYQKDIVVGTGRVLAAGDSIEVYYKGNLTGGFNFDARARPATPFATRLDSTYIIKGWVLGLARHEGRWHAQARSSAPRAATASPPCATSAAVPSSRPTASSSSTSNSSTRSRCPDRTPQTSNGPPHCDGPFDMAGAGFEPATFGL